MYCITCCSGRRLLDIGLRDLWEGVQLLDHGSQGLLPLSENHLADPVLIKSGYGMKKHETKYV